MFLLRKDRRNRFNTRKMKKEEKLRKRPIKKRNNKIMLKKGFVKLILKHFEKLRGYRIYLKIQAFYYFLGK